MIPGPSEKSGDPPCGCFGESEDGGLGAGGDFEFDACRPRDPGTRRCMRSNLVAGRLPLRCQGYTHPSPQNAKERNPSADAVAVRVVSWLTSSALPPILAAQLNPLPQRFVCSGLHQQEGGYQESGVATATALQEAGNVGALGWVNN